LDRGFRTPHSAFVLLFAVMWHLFGLGGAGASQDVALAGEAGNDEAGVLVLKAGGDHVATEVARLQEGRAAIHYRSALSLVLHGVTPVYTCHGTRPPLL